MNSKEAIIALEEVIGLGILGEAYDFDDCRAFLEKNSPPKQVCDELRRYYYAKELFFYQLESFPKDPSRLDSLLGIYLSSIKTTQESMSRLSDSENDLFHTLSAERSLLLHFEERSGSIGMALGDYQSPMIKSRNYVFTDTLPLVGSKSKKILEMLKSITE